MKKNGKETEGVERWIKERRVEERERKIKRG